jgi:hypothetical protein
VKLDENLSNKTIHGIVTRGACDIHYGSFSIIFFNRIEKDLHAHFFDFFKIIIDILEITREFL